MACKLIYFQVWGRHEQAEFCEDESREDMRELFRVAAEARPYDTLKLFNWRGNMVTISPRLQPNTPDTRYRLEVLSVLLKQEDISNNHLDKNIVKIKERLAELEAKVCEDHAWITPELATLREKTDKLRDKLEGMEHLSWLGLFKNMSVMGASHPFWDKRKAGRSGPDYNQRVYDKFMAMAALDLSEEVREQLKQTTFDNWQWDYSEILILVRQMFLDLGLIKKFQIEMPRMLKWLYKVYTKYNKVPFHNFEHAFTVIQMMYSLIWLIDLPSKLESTKILALLIASLCHDLDHPGYNNAYQINARTPLAIRYNDISPLENHHSAIAFEILESEECNLFRDMPRETYRELRADIITCILATDMSKHNEHVNSFKAAIPNFDLDRKDHSILLMISLIKLADISIECRPMAVSSHWMECLLQEFFSQSDTEKLEGLPVNPIMDRDKVSKPMAQIGFINMVLMPLLEAVATIFPVITADVVEPVRKQLAYYIELQKAIDKGDGRCHATPRKSTLLH